MKIDEMIKKGILIPPTDFFKCPKCGCEMEHGFRINSYLCPDCGYIEEQDNVFAPSYMISFEQNKKE